MSSNVNAKKYKLIDDLAVKAKKEGGISYELLFNMLKPLITSVVYKFARYNPDDAFQDSYIVMVSCIKSFDPAKGPFLSYFKQHLRFYMLDSLKKQKETLPIVEEILSDMDLEDDIINKIESHELIDAINSLNEKQKDVIIGYFFKGLSLKDLAQIHGKHYQTIVKIKERALNNLKNYLN